MFDWEQFLTNHNIPFATPGPGVGKDHIAISCPWCGGQGPIHHLGISTIGKGYRCWNNQSHKGRTPHRLIMELIGCSYTEAQKIVGSEENYFITTEESFVDDISRKLGSFVSQVIRINMKTLRPLDEFYFVRSDHGLCKSLVFNYLNTRGYRDKDIDELAHRYNLMWASRGPFAYRVIIPIYMNGSLVTWTGRTFADVEPRYKSLSSDPEKAAALGLPVALRNIKDCLFDYDTLKNGGKTLVVCEGPFDAIRVNWFGEKLGIRATCLFGKLVTAAQIELLHSIARKYKNRVSLVDVDNIKFLSLFGTGFTTFSDITMYPESLVIEQKSLPSGIKDPAMLSLEQFNLLFLS